MPAVERVGHEGAKLVMSTYGRLMPNNEEWTRRAVDTAWSEALDGPGTASASARQALLHVTGP